MPTYQIKIKRTGVQEGILEYTGSFNFSCRCWWDPKDKIPASGKNGYQGCSKTTMAKKKNSSGGPREGIFIPNVPKRSGIFIHYWPGPGADLSKWSDGCTLVLESNMLKIWNDIQPKDGRNVTVIVKDIPAFPSARKISYHGLHLTSRRPLPAI